MKPHQIKARQLRFKLAVCASKPDYGDFKVKFMAACAKHERLAAMGIVKTI